MMLKVISINIFVLALYGFLIIVNNVASERGFSIAIGMGLCIFIQVLLNFIAGIIFLFTGKREWVKRFFVSAGLLIPVGFITWLILLSIYG